MYELYNCLPKFPHRRNIHFFRLSLTDYVLALSPHFRRPSFRILSNRVATECKMRHVICSGRYVGSQSVVRDMSAKLIILLWFKLTAHHVWRFVPMRIASRFSSWIFVRKADTSSVLPGWAQCCWKKMNANLIGHERNRKQVDGSQRHWDVHVRKHSLNLIMLFHPSIISMWLDHRLEIQPGFAGETG